jgi:tetratricopeptide (TPR) repeat protein
LPRRHPIRRRCFVPETRCFSAHRLVQAAARDALRNDAPQWAQGALAAAFAAYPQPEPATWAVCARLTPHARAVAGWITADSRELAWLLGTVATYLQERAAVAEVLPLYERARGIFGRLAAAEPERADYQRDLSVSYIKMGDLFSALGQGEDARQAFGKSLAIAERLAQAEPERADYQRDLSISYIKMGDLFSALGQGEDARQAFGKSLAIRERLAQAEPDRADYQRDLIVSWVKMSEIEADRAGQHLSRALAIARDLQDRGRLMPSDVGIPGELARRLAALAAPPARLSVVGRLMQRAAFWRARS